MAHLTGFGLENFRVFEKETWFDFAPITILTGTNSSGKSNVAKGLICLNEVISSLSIPVSDLFVDYKYEYDFLTKHFGTPSEIINNFSSRNDFSFKLEYLKGRTAALGFILNGKEVALNSFCLNNNNNNEKYISINGLCLENSKVEYFLNFEKCNINSIYPKDGNLVFTNIELKEFLKQNKETIYSYNKGNEKFVPYKKWLNKNASDEIKKIFFTLKDYYYESHFFNEVTDKVILKKLKQLESKVLSKLNFSIHEKNGRGVTLHTFGDIDNNILDTHTALLRNPLFFIVHLIRNKSFYSIKEILFLNKETTEYFDFILDNDIFPILNIDVNSKQAIFMSLIYNNTTSDLGLLYVRHGHSNKISVNHFFKNQPRYYYLASNTDNDFGKIIVDLFLKSKNIMALSFINKYIKIFEIGDEFDYELKGDIVKLFINKSAKKINIADLGTGITQLLTLILKLGLESRLSGSSNKLITFEEPEINLHPALQSKLADMFVDATKTFNIQFIIETHSEYLIRRLQYLTAKKEIKPEDTIIHYLFNPESEHTKKTGEQLRTIRIQEDGRLDKEFGTGFFDESTKLIEGIWEARNLN